MMTDDYHGDEDEIEFEQKELRELYENARADDWKYEEVIDYERSSLHTRANGCCPHEKRHGFYFKNPGKNGFKIRPIRTKSRLPFSLDIRVDFRGVRDGSCRFNRRIGSRLWMDIATRGSHEHAYIRAD